MKDKNKFLTNKTTHSQQENPAGNSSTKLRKKKPLKKIILRIILAIIFLPPIIFIIFRNPIIEKVAEVSLSAALARKVEINKFHLGILRPEISLGSLYIDSENDPNKYDLITSTIKIAFRIRPFLKNRLISITEIIFDGVHLDVTKSSAQANTTLQAPRIISASTEIASNPTPNMRTNNIDNTKPGPVLASFKKTNIAQADEPNSNTENNTKTSAEATDENSKINSLLEKVDVEKIFLENISRLKTTKQIENLKKEISKFQENSTETLSAASLEIAEYTATINEISNNVGDITTPDALASNLQEATRVLADIQKTNKTLASIQANTKKYIDKTTNIGESFAKSSKADTEFMLDLILDPKLLASDLSKNLMSDILGEKMLGYYQQVQTSLKIIKDLHDYWTGPNSDRPVDFRIGFLKLNVGKDRETFFSIVSSNITNIIYTTNEPTQFEIIGGNTNTIQVSGEGKISLYPQADQLVHATITYKGIPLFVENLSLIELENISSTIGGDVSFYLKDTATGSISMSSQLSETSAIAIDGTKFGTHIADAIKNNNSINIQASGEAANSKLSKFAVESNFFEKISAIITELLRAQLFELSGDVRIALEKGLQSYIAEQLSQDAESLNVLSLDTDASSAQADTANAEAEMLLADAQNAHNDILKAQAEAAKKEAEEQAKQQAAQEAKNAVENIKKSIPSFP